MIEYKIALISLFLKHSVIVLGIISDDVTVETKVGLIRGIKATDGNYSQFLGIPYATVDKENPFGQSTPHSKFDNIFHATDNSLICPQRQESNGSTSMSLDCLHLSVYVPDSVSINNRFPVLVFIHGGGFAIGDSRKSKYGPKFLVRHDIILVTFNYRLGPYGFMCLHTAKVPGNQGLKDQLLALRWIKDNIEAFGGDVDSITVAGGSAGARAVDLHLSSPQEKLFHRAILQSGSVLNPGWFSGPDLQAPVKVAEALGYTGANVDDAIVFLAKEDTKSVIEAVARTNVVFRLCVEKKFDGTERLIPEHPIHVDLPKVAGMPILLGHNSQEMLSEYVSQNSEFFETLNLFYDRLKITFDFNNEILTELEKIVRNFYIGDEKMSYENKFELADFDSDTMYVHPTVRNIARFIKNKANKIFYYVFSHNGGRNFVKSTYNMTLGGTNHADELGYIFDMEIFSEEPLPEDQKVIDRMTTLWSNFVKYGDPTPSTTELLTVKWEPITKDSVHHYLDIDSELKVKTKPFHKRMAFWDLFFEAYAEYEIGNRERNSSSRHIMHPCSVFVFIVLWLSV